MRKSYESLTAPSKIGLVVLVALLCFMVVFFLSDVLAIPIWGTESFLKLVNSGVTMDAENIGLLKYFQLAQSIGLFVIPPFILAYLFGSNVLRYLQINKSPLWKSILLSLVIISVMSPLINLLGVWNAKLVLPNFLSGVEEWMKKSEADAKVLTDLFLVAHNGWGLLLNLFIIAFIPAIGEEFLFRGVIQKIFHQWTKNAHWGIWITAILFSALHMQFYGFLPRVLLGALFGYLLVWSGNLWLPVIAHFFNNGMAVMAYYYYNKGVLKVDPETIGTETYLWPVAILSLILIYYLSKQLIKIESKNQKEYSD
jgi:membrane protease YdiL (CAAX protease family)